MLRHGLEVRLLVLRGVLRHGPDHEYFALRGNTGCWDVQGSLIKGKMCFWNPDCVSSLSDIVCCYQRACRTKTELILQLCTEEAI